MPCPYVAIWGKSRSPTSAIISSSSWFRCWRKTRVTPSASSSRDSLGDLLDGAREPAVATFVEHSCGIDVSSPNGEEGPDPVAHLRAARAEEAGGHHGEAEGRGIPPCVPAGAIEARLSLAELVVRRAEGVDLVGEPRRERREAGLDAASQDERRMGLLQRTGQSGQSAQLETRSTVVEGIFGPRPDDDLDLLGEKLEPLFRVEEREPVLDVLAFVPTCAHPDVDASSRDVVDGDGHPGKHARVAEGRRRHERAEPDSVRHRGEPRECRPGVERSGLRADDGRVVIRSEEPFETMLLGEACQPHPVVPGDTFLPFDHQAHAHAQTMAARAVGSMTGLWHTKRSQT